MPLRSITTRPSLLGRLRDGDDPLAWRTLVETYRPLLLETCRVRGLQPADADDVVQAVFVGLARGLRTFDYDPTKGRFRDYLFRCLTNAISRWGERRAREQRLPSAQPPGDLPQDPGDLEQVFEREWIHHHYRCAVRRVLERCEPRGVEIFEAAVAGKDAPAIAAALGISEAAVYKSLARTRQRLREAIADQLDAEDGLHG